MAITVGTDAYISLADYKAWADARGYAYGADAVIEAAIVIGTDFVDGNYTFKGDKVDPDQVLQLPTDEVSIADIEKGIAQAVYLQLSGRLYVDPTEITQAGQVVSSEDSVGSLSSSRSYAEGYQYTNTYPTTTIDIKLRPYTVSGGLGTVVRG